jgi:thiol-disulfide isomerase/thioredoxin
MRKSLKSFGMGMSMAIAAAIAVPSAYAADAPAGTAAPSETSEQKKLGVGDAAPAWKDLVGVDDQKHSLGEHADAKAVVVVFTCNHCPVAKAYEDRIVEIATDYADKDVDVVAINVNNMDADKLPAMKERAEEKGFKFNYLYDPSQEIGRAYGATVTPHVFLLDGERNIAYIGAIDDNMKADKATKPYLRDAIDAVLAGSKPETNSTKPVGCGIKYE